MNNESPILQTYYGKCGVDIDGMPTESYKLLLTKAVEYDDTMRKMLATDSKKLEHYLATANALDMMHNELAESNYVNGFSFGFRLALNILAPNKLSD